MPELRIGTSVLKNDFLYEKKHLGSHKQKASTNQVNRVTWVCYIPLHKMSL